MCLGITKKEHTESKLTACPDEARINFAKLWLYCEVVFQDIEDPTPES